MGRLATLGDPCVLCLSRTLTVFADDQYDGLIVNCPICGFDDFIFNPFADKRFFSDVPLNCCLVYSDEESIDAMRGAVV